MNPKYLQIGTSLFPLLTEKSRKGWISTVKMGIVLPLLLILKNHFSVTKTSFEKPPEGCGARG